MEYNQTKAHAKGYLTAAAFLKTGSGNIAYETDIEIPIWDIYTESHMAVGKKDEDDGKYYILTKATVTNKGKSPTPGPIQGSFIINDAETGRYITGWSGQTNGPVSGGTDIYAKTPSSLKLPPKITVNSSIIPLCPDGKAGGLGDGDAKNNVRELKQQ